MGTREAWMGEDGRVGLPAVPVPVPDPAPVAAGDEAQRRDAVGRQETTGPVPLSPVPAPTPARIMAEVAVASAGIGTYEWDLATGDLVWDERILEMFGHTEATFTGRIDAFNDRIHPDDLPGVTRALEQAIASAGSYDLRYRVVHPDGATLWVAARGQVLTGPDGRPAVIAGAAYDVTRRTADARHVARVLETMPTAFFSLDHQWRFTYVNTHAEHILGAPRDALLGQVVWDAFPAAVGTEFEEQYRRAVTTGRPVSFDAYYPPPLDAWYEVRAWPTPDGLSVFFQDVTGRTRDRQRLELTASVTAALTRTLDPQRAVADLARVVLPHLADWCLVSTVTEVEDRAEPVVEDIGAAHADAGREHLVRAYARHRLSALSSESFLMRAIRSGEPVVVRERTVEQIEGLLGPGPARDALHQLDPVSLAIVPIHGRTGVIGVLSLFHDHPRPVDDDQVATAVEVAARAGLALDNARLFHRQQHIAETWQRAQLDLPAVPGGLEVAARYLPAARAAQVGGDWYDLFTQPDGAAVAVIGDVTGHDIDAAAAMGQVRAMLRGVALSTESGPAGVLGHVDRALERLGGRLTATALVARLEGADRPGDEPVALRWSTAGHLPPLLLVPGREPELLRGRSDVMLGVTTALPRGEHVRELVPGSTLVLYTDGLVERRDRPLREGLARLVAAARRSALLEPESLCDHLQAELLPATLRDDVALLAVRVPGGVGRAGR